MFFDIIFFFLHFSSVDEVDVLAWEKTSRQTHGIDTSATEIH